MEVTGDTEKLMLFKGEFITALERMGYNASPRAT